MFCYWHHALRMLWKCANSPVGFKILYSNTGSNPANLKIRPTFGTLAWMSRSFSWFVTDWREIFSWVRFSRWYWNLYGTELSKVLFKTFLSSCNIFQLPLSSIHCNIGFGYNSGNVVTVQTNRYTLQINVNHEI